MQIKIIYVGDKRYVQIEKNIPVTNQEENSIPIINEEENS